MSGFHGTKKVIWEYLKEAAKASIVGLIASGLIFYGIATTFMSNNEKAHAAYEAKDKEQDDEIGDIQQAIARNTVLLENLSVQMTEQRADTKKILVRMPRE